MGRHRQGIIPTSVIFAIELDIHLYTFAGQNLDDKTFWGSCTSFNVVQCWGIANKQGRLTRTPDNKSRCRLVEGIESLFCTF